MKVDLEKSVGIHRRKRGFGRSKINDPFGTFDFKWRHNPHTNERKTICTVRRGEGWNCLSISVKERDSKGKWWNRKPNYAEIYRLLPLFYEPDDCPIQMHNVFGNKESKVDLYESAETIKMIKKVPQFIEGFSLTKE